MTEREYSEKVQIADLQKAANGNRSAFKQLYDFHSKRVYNICLRTLGNSLDAEEVTQDVFITLWQKADKFRGDSKVSSWLYRIALNKSINYQKAGGFFNKIKNVFSINLEDQFSIRELIAPAKDQPDKNLEQKKAEITLANLMAKLPERQAEVYLLHKLEGYSYQEIAEELNITLSSVESLMHRAKVNLQQRISNNIAKKRKK